MRGKSSIGWFHGFKLHIVINQLGEIINIAFTSGNVHDAKILGCSARA
ncbi:MAG: transposase [Acinetobacter sp.]